MSDCPTSIIDRTHAIFGWSDKCVAVMPSDMCVALDALDAVVKVQGTDGKERSIPFIDYYRLPGDTPQKDNNLNQGELITWIEIPKNNFAGKSYYLKIRDRASYAFALVSVAAALEIEGNQIKQASLAMGGVSLNRGVRLKRKNSSSEKPERKRISNRQQKRKCDWQNRLSITNSKSSWADERLFAL